MTYEQQIETYTQRALQAEKQAFMVSDPSLRADWHRISKAYYDLAESLVRNASILATLQRLPHSPNSEAPH
jgi:hypothetical protein